MPALASSWFRLIVLGSLLLFGHSSPSTVTTYYLSSSTSHSTLFSCSFLLSLVPSCSPACLYSYRTIAPAHPFLPPLTFVPSHFIRSVHSSPIPLGLPGHVICSNRSVNSTNMINRVLFLTFIYRARSKLRVVIRASQRQQCFEPVVPCVWGVERAWVNLW